MQINLKTSISSKRMVQTSPSQKFPRLFYWKVLSLLAAGPSEPGGRSLKSEVLGPCPSPTRRELFEDRALSALFTSVSSAPSTIPGT